MESAQHRLYVRAIVILFRRHGARKRLDVFGMSGDGSFIPGPPGMATISNLPLPSRFTVFTQTGSTVSNGTNIATFPYEMLSAQHGSRLESAAGCCPVGTAVVGGITKNNAIGAHPPSNGITVLAWVLRLPDT